VRKRKTLAARQPARRAEIPLYTQEPHFVKRKIAQNQEKGNPEICAKLLLAAVAGLWYN